ncbi:hypothetical protein LJR219_005185 [Phenylobacterium sp. LjRoot219]
MREGRLSPTYLIDRYTLARRRATIVALLIDLEARLIDAAIEMADRLIGAAFSRGRSAQEHQYSATARTWPPYAHVPGCQRRAPVSAE